MPAGPAPMITTSRRLAGIWGRQHTAARIPEHLVDGAPASDVQLTIDKMTARVLVALGLLVAASNAHAEGSVDHAKTRFPLSGKHRNVACESCHPASAGGT